MEFNQLNLKDQLLRAVDEMGYESPSEIQSRAIPVLLEGRDMIGMSQTGSGKTAAFGLPLLNNLQPLDSRRTKALILCPTRELCLQVAGEMKKYAHYLHGIRIVSVYGGQDINRQIRDIKRGAEIVVATPGRLLDHMRRRTLRFDNCNTVVLDEADEMLNMGFLDDIRDILSQLPEKRQTVLFSATMPREIQRLAERNLDDPVTVRVKGKTMTVDTIDQIAYQVLPRQKKQLMMQLLELYKTQSTLVFCNTKRMVDELTGMLNKSGYKAQALHGDIRQDKRTRIMNGFKNKEFNLLIATDVAARGIDVDRLDLVINYDLPQENEYYVHRIGRTGRAGESGTAISFYGPREEGLLKQLERLTKHPIERRPLPSQKDLSELTVGLLEKEIIQGLENPAERSQHMINELMELGYEREDILFGLVSRLVGQHSHRPLDPVHKPSRRRGKRPEFSLIKIGLGRKHGIKPANLIAGICDNTGISGRDIGKIKISNSSSTVEIPKDDQDRILQVLSQSKINGRTPYVAPATREKKRNRKPRKRKGK